MTSAPFVPTRDRCLPVDEAFVPMLPDAGLVRGRVIGCTGPAATSLALALAARATMTGSWLAVVGVPELGVEAVAELGVPLERLVAVDSGDRAAVWAERVAVAADGFDVVLTRPPSGAERVARKVRQRLQARGVVMLVVGSATPGVSCDVECTTAAVEWAGLGHGHGVLTGRRATVRIGGRRVPRATERELWLPGPSGGVSVVDRAGQRRDVGEHPDVAVPVEAGDEMAVEAAGPILERAG